MKPLSTPFMCPPANRLLLILHGKSPSTITLWEGNSVMIIRQHLQRPLYQKKHRHHRMQVYRQRQYCQRMPRGWIKRFSRVFIMSILSYALTGCVGHTHSVIPQSGPTMRAIYESAQSPHPTLPAYAQLYIFSHRVKMGNELIKIPDYTTQFSLR